MYTQSRSLFKTKVLVMVAVLLFVAIISIAGVKVFAQENYQAEYFEEEMLENLSAHPSLVATDEQFELYSEEFTEYVLEGGILLVTSDEDGMIGMKYSVADGEIKATPLVAISADENTVEKDNINYLSVLDDSDRIPQTRSTNVGQNGSMFLSTTFYIYANNQSSYIAVSGIYTYVDYYQTIYSGVNYFNIFVEVYVMPVSNVYKVEGFSVDFNALTNGCLEVKTRSYNNNISPSVGTLTHDMGTSAGNELLPGVSSVINYTPSTANSIDGISISGGTPVNYDSDGDGETEQIQSLYSVTPLSATYGKTYSALFVHTYRTYNNVSAGYYIGLHDISITGMLWYPNFEENNEDTVVASGTWGANFTNKYYLLMYGNTADSHTDDYFGNFAYTSSLPQSGGMNGVIIFEEG